MSATPDRISGNPREAAGAGIAQAVAPGVAASGVQPLTKSLAYRPDIDGLRAVAVLAVVAFHAFPQGIRGAFVGVDVFFVISGFLISTIILQKLERGTFSFSGFYARRVKRLFPALLVVLAACLLAGWFGMVADEYRQLGKHTAAAAGFVSNFFYWNESGYFDSSAYTKPLLHMWSLGIEEQFYIGWPLLLWLCRRAGWNAFWVMAWVALGSFASNVWMVNTDSAMTYYSPQSRVWELAIGSMLAHVHNAGRSAAPARLGGEEIRSAAGLALIGVSVVFLTREALFPGWWALLPTLGAALVISAQHAWINRVVLSNRWMVLVGLISYPLYLWHWPILVFQRLSEVDTPSRDARMAAVALSIALAWLTYRLVERPVSRLKDSKTIPALAGGMTLMLAIGCAGFASGGFSSRNADAGYSLNQAVMDSFVDWKYTSNRLCTERYPFKESNNYATWFCMQSNQRDPTLVLLGSSYANQLYPGFAHNPRLKDHTVLSIGMCDPAKVDEGPLENAEDPNPCIGRNLARQQKFYEQLIERNHSIRFVVLDGLNREPDAGYIARLKERIDFLEKRNIRVIVFGPHLRLGFNPRACFTTPMRRNARDCTIPLDERARIDAKFRPLVASISKTNPGVLFFDQNEMYCGSQNCSMVREGRPLARDYGHITESGSELLQGYFSEWARVNLPEIFDAPATPAR